MSEWDHHQKPQCDDPLPDQHASRLPGTEVGNPGKWMRAQAENIRQPGKDRKDVTSGDQPRADVGKDGAFPSPPQGMQAEITPKANQRQPEEKDDDLDEAHHRTAVPAKI